MESAVEIGLVTARLLDSDEVLPTKYADDPLFKVMKYDPNWVWVVERETKVIGYLITTPVYPMVTLLRLRMDDDAPAHSVIVLLRKFFHDVRQRTFKTMNSQFDLTEEAEKKLAYGMVKFFGGRMFVNVVAPLPKED